MPLTLAPEAEALRVVKVLTEEKTRKHLESLGITVNSTLKILSRSGGSIILAVKEGRLALDRDVATKILVA